MYAVQNCPVCSNSDFKHVGEAKDHTVSHETFHLVKCTSCGFLMTSPRPDDDDLARYYLSPDYVSHNARATSLFDKVYSASREFTLRNKLTLVKKYSKGKDRSILDYGCGTGNFLRFMQKNGFNIAGVEPSTIARTHAQNLTGIKIESSLEGINSQYTTITLWHVLEHVPNLNEQLSQIKSHLQPSGTIIIAVPNHQSHDARKYGTTWAGYDVPRHLWHFEQQTMTRLLKNNKLKVTEIIPMKLDAFYVSMLSEKYIAGTQTPATLIKGFISGLTSNLQARNKNYSSLIYIASHQ